MFPPGIDSQTDNAILAMNQGRPLRRVKRRKGRPFCIHDISLRIRMKCLDWDLSEQLPLGNGNLSEVRVTVQYMVCELPPKSGSVSGSESVSKNVEKTYA
ncbi:hypothetical protein JCM31598_12970 [Desulfonatronum parangueonense]